MFDFFAQAFVAAFFGGDYGLCIATLLAVIFLLFILLVTRESRYAAFAKKQRATIKELEEKLMEKKEAEQGMRPGPEQQYGNYIYKNERGGVDPESRRSYEMPHSQRDRGGQSA